MSEPLELGFYYRPDKDDFTLIKIPQEDRATHFYIIGATGTGKSKFIEYLIIQDLGVNGLTVIDPHGDLVEEIKGWTVAKGLEEGSINLFSDVVLVDPTDEDSSVSFNPLERIPGVSAAEQALDLVLAFKKVWKDFWGPRLEDILRNSLIALIENDLTLLEMPLFLSNSAFREKILGNVENALVRQYFRDRFEELRPKTRAEWIESTLNKVNSFLVDERLRDLFSAPHSSFNLREIMDQGKILLVKLAKGRLKENGDLLGALLVSKIEMAALSRTDIPPEERSPFYLYIDEFQNFATDSFLDILAEARKYGLSLIMAHQNLDQLDPIMQAAILANTGIQVYFRLNRQDAERIAREAFRTTGTEIKFVHFDGHDTQYQLYTYQEEWERYIQELLTLKPRECYIKHKREGGVLPIYTVTIPELWKETGFESESEFKAFVESFPLGGRYVASRDFLREEHKKRMEKLVSDSEEEISFRE